MKGILVKKDEKVKVNIYVSIAASGSIVASHVKEAVEQLKGEEAGIYEFEAVFRKPSYRDDVNVLSDSLRSDGNNVELNPAALRYLRLNQLLESWTLVDEDGKPVPATPESIDSLSSAVGNALVLGLDAALNP